MTLQMVITLLYVLHCNTLKQVNHTPNILMTMINQLQDTNHLDHAFMDKKLTFH